MKLVKMKLNLRLLKHLKRHKWRVLMLQQSL